MSVPVYFQCIFVIVVEQVEIENLFIREIFQLISEIMYQRDTKTLFFAMQDFVRQNIAERLF